MATEKGSQLYTKPTYRWPILLAALVASATGLVLFHNLARRSNLHTQAVKAPKTAPARIVRVAVTGLGRLQPQGEVTRLFAPSSLSGVRVEKMLVKEGDEVRSGQVVALLESYARAKAALQQASDKVQIAQAQLAQVKAGAKTGEVDAQKAAITRLESQLKGDTATKRATITRLQAELENAQTENNRYQQLYNQGAISASTADSKRLQQQTVQQQLTAAQADLNSTVNTINDQLREAKAKLGSIKEVRVVDVKLADVQVQSAITAVQQAKADYDLTYLKSPIDGRILKVHAKTGEVSTNEGIVDIGKTSQMYVEAEIYQTDISKVRIGQKATITSTAFSKKIKGTVSEIGLQVDRQNILSVNPAADTDRRIIQVKIRIDDPADSQRVAGLTNLQVDVAIHIQSTVNNHQ
ncbi:MAG: HlyD family efflux transporter periplasmic adaptor subunit [Brasilonema octagenarum HA4186-MV1]|jgi:HlyD family secretion protein|uniref:HlyD family secretion protein n=1 Tax=Brasilonema sennae CENA114 TaxID=415709 RepID=A0A856ME97_9CYAN|nr:ABC exporter membrane fusion protein [Brasilonema sennae]MBW4627485.1 HlyD family efflux transporter periplasmic adaptor subunit [Brasilonema octagenarum HA4186-MV1]QDL08011.1 HlyD family secretion protein [Brasilonema sennae CENA114]QDL14371.1 HlyD family secretion protein [Brasilonema octagenarum UFV-E1]